MGCGVTKSGQDVHKVQAVPKVAIGEEFVDANAGLKQNEPVLIPSWEQLKDPAFVFKCCDANGDGSLNEHELLHALRACGVEHAASATRDLELAEFAELLQVLKKSEDLRCRPTVPHALRGISLDQMQQIQRIFLDSGWLLACCELENASGKSRYVMEEDLNALNRYVVTPVTQPRESPARDQSAGEIPLASFKSSYSELVNPQGRFIHFFVSHYWGHPFAKTVLALRLWAEGQHRTARMPTLREVSFWICLFAINQHKAGEEVGSSPDHGPFNAALASAAHGAVMVVGADLVPFKRVWCLFEVRRLFTLRINLDLISDLGPLSYRASDQGIGEEIVALQEHVAQALQHVKAIDATASKEEDKFSIWYACADPTIKNVSYEDAKGKFCDSVAFVGFDQMMQGLLATPMLRASVAEKKVEKMLQWCMLGAHFGAAELDTLELHGIKPVEYTDPQRGSLLVVAAGRGNLAGVEALLDRKADLTVCGTVPEKEFWGTAMYGTPLFWSSFNGYRDIVQLLLAHKADPDVKFEQQLATPLVVAARANHHEVVRCLLDHRANVDLSTRQVPKSALHEACAFGGLESVKLLHEGGADLAHRCRRGWTALEYASHLNNTTLVEYLAKSGSQWRRQRLWPRLPLPQQWQAAAPPPAAANTDLITSKDTEGKTSLHYAMESPANAATVKQLVFLRADLEAVTNAGVTPLIHSVLHGDGECHKFQVLLDMNSDVQANDSQGCTALLHASYLGKDEIVKKLLDHGADVQATTNAALNPIPAPPKLVLVSKNSQERCIVATQNLLRQTGVVLALISHCNGIIVALQNPTQMGPFSIVELGVGASCNDMHLRVNYDGNYILRDIDAMDLNVPYNRYVEGQNLILLRGPHEPQQFSVNDDGTISPKSAPHLVLGASLRYNLFTPLHAAVFGGHAAIAVLLLKSRADPEARDGDGKTPEEMNEVGKRLASIASEADSCSIRAI